MKISCIISTENFNKIDINQGYTQIILIYGLINLKNHNKVYIFIFVIKLPFQWYKKLQLNICYISSSLIQIIKFPDDIMKKCILTINNLQFMYFVVNYFVPYDKWSGIHPCAGEHHMFCTHKQSPFSLYCSGEYDIYVLISCGQIHILKSFALRIVCPVVQPLSFSSHRSLQ
jgi:hypothetical protein